MHRRALLKSAAALAFSTVAEPLIGAVDTTVPVVDAHIHLFLTEVNLALLEGMPLTLLTTKAVVNARNMLMRGFTTVRDTGGCDQGTKTAAESGIIDSPRLIDSPPPAQIEPGQRAGLRTPLRSSCQR